MDLQTQFSFLIQLYKTILSVSIQFWGVKLLVKCWGALVCIFDHNYALVLVSQHNIIGMCNPFRHEDSVLISHSNSQNHCCLDLFSFGELKD